MRCKNSPICSICLLKQWQDRPVHLELALCNHTCCALQILGQGKQYWHQGRADYYLYYSHRITVICMLLAALQTWQQIGFFGLLHQGIHATRTDVWDSMCD